MGERKNFKLKIALISVAFVLAVAITFLCTFFVTRDAYKYTYLDSYNYACYDLACHDSITAEKDEIRQLVTITADSDMVTWNDEGTKALMISWHKYPDSYKAGSAFECVYGEIWTFTDREILAWSKKDGSFGGVDGWELRFEQLIGLPMETEYTHFTAFWVEPSEMIRPAYQPDITKPVTEADLDGSALGVHEAWFNQNLQSSYGENAYPWTRLGYTYDWTADGEDYGLSEFIILPNSTVEVAWTVTTQDFIKMLQSGSLTIA